MSTQTSTQLRTDLPAGNWTVDPVHTTIGFVARHMMVTKVRGSFGDFTADVTVADDPLKSEVVAVVQMASIDTGSADRDGHLRTNDFFDVERYPTMTLRSTEFSARGDGFVMTADLTIKDVTRSVDFDLEFDGVGQDPWGGTRAGFTATATVNRRDWNVQFNAPLESGGVLVGDKVTIEIDVQLVKS